MSHFKVIILVDPPVGKSSFLVCYTDIIFTEVNMSTIGMDYKFKNVELDNRNTIRLQIWDISSKEHFNNNLYKGAAGIALYMISQK